MPIHCQDCAIDGHPCWDAAGTNLITVETPDISEYLDSGWYDRVWFKEDVCLGEIQMGRFLGTSQKVGSLMSYWILPESVIPVPRTNGTQTLQQDVFFITKIGTKRMKNTTKGW